MLYIAEIMAGLALGAILTMLVKSVLPQRKPIWAATTDLRTLTQDDLCEIYWNLNLWNWDDRLGQAPEKWETIPTFAKRGRTRHDYVHPIMKAISVMVSDYDLWHWDYINRRGMTEAEAQIAYMKHLAFELELRRTM